MVEAKGINTGKLTDPKELKQNSNAPTMHVKVYSPFQTYFDDDANSISGINETGPFDILPRHHNFLTLLNSGDLVIQTPRQKHSIKITRGLMHVKANQVIVFLDV